MRAGKAEGAKVMFEARVGDEVSEDCALPDSPSLQESIFSLATYFI